MRQHNQSPKGMNMTGFSFTNIHDSQDGRGRGEGIYLTPVYHFHALQRHLVFGARLMSQYAKTNVNATVKTDMFFLPS